MVTWPPLFNPIETISMQAQSMPPQGAFNSIHQTKTLSMYARFMQDTQSHLEHGTSIKVPHPKWDVSKEVCRPNGEIIG